jgi:hypothetical protein
MSRDSFPSPEGRGLGLLRRRSLLSLAGSLLAEISIPKLAVAWIWLIVVPSLMLGVAPIVGTNSTVAAEPASLAVV